MSTERITIEPGQKVYTRDGRKAFYVAETTEGHIIKVGNQDEYGEVYYDQMECVGQVFTSPLTEAYDEKIVALRAEIESLANERKQLREERMQAESEGKEAAAKFAKFAGLRNLELFIDKKITHFVVEPWSAIEIHTFDAFMFNKDDPRNMRLMVLFGDSKGDMQWRVNTYRDGSGYYTNAYPCVSLEEAQEYAARRFSEKCDELRANIAIHPTQTHQASGLMKIAEGLGIECPADIKAMYVAYIVDSNQAELVEAHARVAELMANIEKAKA